MLYGHIFMYNTWQSLKLAGSWIYQGLFFGICVHASEVQAELGFIFHHTSI